MRRTFSMEVAVEVLFLIPDMPADERECAHPKLEITFGVQAGVPTVPEVDFIKAKLIDSDGLTPTKSQVDDWAREWLDSDTGSDAAVSYATAYREVT